MDQPLLILSLKHTLSIKLDHFLESYDIDVWDEVLFEAKKQVSNVKVVMRETASTVPSEEGTLQLTPVSEL